MIFTAQNCVNFLAVLLYFIVPRNFCKKNRPYKRPVLESLLDVFAVRKLDQVFDYFLKAQMRLRTGAYT